MYCVLALEYSATQGISHKVKSFEQVADAKNSPEWFTDGVNAAHLAPTAMNRKKFTFSYENGKVSTKVGVGFYFKIDFELGGGKGEINWI